LSIFRGQFAQAMPHFLPQDRLRRWALIHVRKIVGSNLISLTARWKVSILPTGLTQPSPSLPLGETDAERQ
jgi:hypothetical protein